MENCYVHTTVIRPLAPERIYARLVHGRLCLIVPIRKKLNQSEIVAVEVYNIVNAIRFRKISCIDEFILHIYNGF